MSDERIVKAAADRLHDQYCDHDEGDCWDDDRWELFAVSALAALRDAGFDVYRPVRRIIWYCDECGKGAESRSDLPCPHHDMLPTYRLVPVESPKENQ